MACQFIVGYDFVYYNHTANLLSPLMVLIDKRSYRVWNDLASPQSMLPFTEFMKDPNC